MAGIVIYNEKQRGRLALANMPGVAKALDAVDKVIFKAQFHRPISDYTMPELISALPELIRASSFDVGCRITEGDMASVVDRCAVILSRYYTMLTLAEFRTAFEMCALGELDKYLPKKDGQPDRGHYQQFNPEYISKVLRAYRLRRAETMRKAEDARPREETRDLAAEQEAWREVRGYFYADWLYYKYHGRMPVISPAAVIIYTRVLARLGWVDDRFAEVTPPEQTEAINSTAAFVAGKQTKCSQWTARKRAEIERAFRDMVEDEIQFDKFI